MRIEGEGKLKVLTAAECGYQPYCPPKCPDCGSRNTVQTSGRNGATLYFLCRDGDHKFRVVA